MNTEVDFLQRLLAGAQPAAPQSWLAELRGTAVERAHRLSAPTLRDEDWRFTDLSPLYQLAFRSAAEPAPLAPEALRPWLAPEAGARLVFVDGRYIGALSQSSADANITVKPLAAAMQSHGEVLRRELARVATYDDDAFRAANTAHLFDGAFVHVAAGAAAKQPVHLLFIATQAEVAVHPRVLVVAETGAEVTLLEDYVAVVDQSGGDAAYCTNAVTEVAVGANARVRHVRIQRETGEAFHVANSAVRLARDATYESNAIALGARISRHNLHVRLDGEGARAHLDGLTLVDGRQLADTHSFIEHARPRGTSRQLHKCVVGGRAHAVFNGRILVARDAQLTDSAQESRNLLLSPDAYVDTKPQLEIFADDVKCSHGATVGQLEAEELFYLRTRGLDETAARNLLTYGFAAEIVARIPLASVAARLREHVLALTQAPLSSFLHP